jgi:transposase
VFTVERHVRGKWVCKCCERIVQAPVPAHVIDKGIPTTGLLAHVLVAKFMDHLPLYRQEAVFARVGHVIARSTLAEWVGACGAQLQPLVQALADELRRHMVLHADETPVAMLKPGNGKTHKAYIWSYCTPSTTPVKAVVFEFSETRSGENVRDFLGLGTPDAWQGTLVTDGFSGYAACVDTAHGLQEVRVEAAATTVSGVVGAAPAGHLPKVNIVPLFGANQPTRVKTAEVR